MAVLQNFKCPCCDGAIEFDSSSQKMKCPYCSSEFEVSDLQAYSNALHDQIEDKMQWDTTAGTQWQPGETEGMRIYTCNTCGGEIVAAGTLEDIVACPRSITGQYLGAGLAMKNGSRIVRPVILIVISLLAVKVFLEFFGIG